MTLGEYPPASFQSEATLPRFTDAAMGLGIDVDGLCGGSVVDDFDNGSDLDVIVTSFGLRDQMRFMKNAGDGSFVDATQTSGLMGQVGAAMGWLSIQDPTARYNGKTIESWFYDETRLGSSDYAVRADEAVGESWIPYLIEKGSRPKKSMPGFVRSQIGIVRHPEHDRGIAFSHLGSLHSVDSIQTDVHYLAPFVPKLMEAANATKDKDARRSLRRLLTHYVLELEDADEKVSFFLQDAESSSVRL